MKRRAYKVIPPAILAALFLSFFSNFFVDHSPVRVTHVIDGDTVVLASGQHLRYIGMDAPELERKTPTGWVKVDDPFGIESKKSNEELVLGKVVRLEFDVQKQDKFNRMLAYCFVKQDDTEVLVQEEILRRGFAYLYTFPPNIKYVDRLVRALQEAKAKKAGIWSVDLNVDSTTAGQFIGQRKMVTGFVKRSHTTARVIHLSLDGLSVVIFKSDMGLFQKQGIDPAEFYKGKKVRVFGLIKEYQGAPEIVISNPWQIDVVDQTEETG